MQLTAHQEVALIEQTSNTLAMLRTRHRFWFWFSPTPPCDQPRLLVSPLQQDPGQEDLQARISAQALVAGAPEWVGLGEVGADGRISLSASGLDEGTLRSLARWVRANAPAHPGLLRLNDLEVIDLRADGIVRDRARAPRLWLGLSAAAVPGTPAGERAILAAMKPGEEAWCWVGAASPWLVLVPCTSDPARAAFFHAVRPLAAKQPPSLIGILKKGDSGSVLTTADPLAGCDALLAALEEGVGGPELAQLSVLQIRDGAVVDSYRAARAPDLSRQATILQTLSEEQPARFWFTDADHSGEPCLLLEQESASLKHAAMQRRGRGRTLRGEVRVSGQGWLEFRTRTDDPQFLGDLAGFMWRHQGRFPALRRLRGARMTVWNKAGERIGRQHNPALWARPTEAK